MSADGPAGEAASSHANTPSPVPEESGRRSLLRVTDLLPISFGHLVQIGVGLAVVVALIRLRAVADGDPQLAVAILAASGYAQPLASLLIVAVPSMLLLVVLFAFRFVGLAFRNRKVDATTGAITIVGICSLIAAALLLGWPFLVFLLVFGLLALGIDRLFPKSEPSVLDVLVQSAALAFILMLLALASRTPWMPEEAIVTTGGTIHGYVLSVGDPWMTVLVDEPRYLRYVAVDEVLDRVSCPAEEPSGLDKLVLGDLQRNASQPECPAESSMTKSDTTQ